MAILDGCEGGTVTDLDAQQGYEEMWSLSYWN